VSGLDLDNNVVAEGLHQRNKPLQRVAGKLSVQDARNIGLGAPQFERGRTLGETLLIDLLTENERKERTQILLR
jgi:hypothetical protein